MKEAEKHNNKSVLSGLVWKFAERFGVQVSLFVLQIVLARILDPEHYGVLSMMLIFTTLANVFIQRGFNTSLVQNEDVTEEDYSSVFWVTLATAAILYMALFAAAPLIAEFYNMPDLVAPFRVLCLVLFPGALNSVQLAKITRNMAFKKVFYSNIIAIFVSGVAGVAAALCGAGLWALVLQKLLNVLIACLVMWHTVKWRPQPVFNIQRVKVLFSYGWKLLLSGLIDTLYQDIRSLVVGKKYSSDMLAYYNRGKQFPQFIINAVDSSVKGVLLPSLSRYQNDKEKLSTMMRTSIVISSYIIFPVMAGLAGVAEPLVRILLTDKWLPCVPYMQIYCFTLAFHPVHSCNLQAINAIGRSDIFLKLEVIKKVNGILALIIAVVCCDSPLAIAMTGIVTTLINCFVNASPNKKLIGYSYWEQLTDILPAFVASFIMLGAVLLVPMLHMNSYITVLIQILVGVTVYILISVIFRIKAFCMLLSMLKKQVKSKKKS